MKQRLFKLCMGMVSMFVCLTLVGSESATGIADAVRLDTRRGVRYARAEEVISFSTDWNDGATQLVLGIGGEDVLTMTSPTNGIYVWEPDLSRSGTVTLVHTTRGAIEETLAATFAVKAYDVVFQPGSDGALTEDVSAIQRIPHGEAAALPVPTRTGYTFIGWFTSADGGTLVTDATTVTADVTYYAHWSPKSYIVTFDANGGVGGTTESRFYDAELGMLPTVVREGCVFEGWYTSASGGTPVSPATIVTGDMTLFAVWEVESPAIPDVSVAPIDSEYGRFTVQYTLAEALPSRYAVRLLFAVGGVTNVMTKITGDLSVTAGTHTVVWDSTEEGVSAGSEGTVLVEISLSPYCVIDLESGSSSADYPVSYLSAMPDEGWTDEYKTTKLVLKLIEAGTFKMQNSTEVTLTQPFYTGVFEVTQKQWELLMGENPCSSTSYGKGDSYPVHFVSYDMIRGSSEGSKWPSSASVDSTSFIGRLQARTGINFDLLTEAQWEYACRAGTTTTYSYGSSANDAYMWYSSNSSSSTHPVGSKQPNPWGFYDMHGNVWEWCLDWYGTLSYGTDPSGVSTGANRVLRGGCWVAAASSATSSSRDYDSPSAVFRSVGFRLARVIPADLTVSGSASFDLPFVVAFDVNGGDAQVGSRLVKKDQCVGDLPVPTRAGYDFDGWFTASSGGTRVTVSSVVTGNVTYYAHWKIAYMVTFDANGGSCSTTSMSYACNATLGTLPAATRTGYEFLGWFTAASGGTQVYGTTVVTDNVTLFAHWASVCAVSFDANGGVGGTTKSVLSNSPLGTLPTVTRTGYTFLGWYTAASGGAQVSSSTVVTGAVTYYAQWRINSYTVTFNANGGSAATSSLARNYNSTLGTLPTATRTGYTFAGWYTAASGGTQVSSSTVVTGAATYYAHWTINSYTVTFNANGGSSSTSSRTRDYNSTLGTLPTATRTGYTFAGWYTAASGGTQVSSSTVVKATVTYYAHWTINSYTVKFDANGGACPVSSKVYVYDSALGALPDATLDGLAFAGWYTQKSGGERVGPETVVVSDITYYARWVEISSVYTDAVVGSDVTGIGKSVVVPASWVTEDLAREYGTGKIRQFYEKYGGDLASALAKPTGKKGPHGEIRTVWDDYLAGTDPTDESSVFKASIRIVDGEVVIDWAPNLNDGTEDRYYRVMGCTSLTANDWRWPPDDERDHFFKVVLTMPEDVSSDVPGPISEIGLRYIVSFDAEGGLSSESNRKVKAGEPVGELPTATRTGYTFAGWYTAASGGTQMTAETPVNGGFICHAHWKTNTYAIVFNANGGTSSTSTMTCAYGSSLGYLPTATRTGYTFAGWYTAASGGTQVTSSTVVTGAVTYYAHWTANTYTVTFNANGGSVSPASKSYTYNTTLGTLPTVTRTGYTFDGWYTAPSGGALISPETRVTGNMTCYAYWTSDGFLVETDADGNEWSYRVVKGGAVIQSPNADTSSAAAVSEVNVSAISVPATLGGFPVRVIGKCALCNCGDLTTVTIPSSVTNIGERAFLNCPLYVVCVDPMGKDRIRQLLSDSESSLDLSKIEFIEEMGVQLWQDGPYWAKVNCGATEVGQVGYYYYNWDDTVGYHVKGGALTGTLEKNSGTTKWESPWRKPTQGEIRELIQYCKVTESKDFGGVKCAKVSGTGDYADKYVWFPLAGWGNGGFNGTGNNWGVCGKYWAEGSGGAILQHLMVYSDSLSTGLGGANHGNYYPIRMVLDPSNVTPPPPQRYKVVFDANGGTLVENKRFVVSGSSIGTLPTVTRTGYTFNGWYTAASGGTQVTAETPVNGGFTCHAQWKTNTYAIVFNANGGTSSTSTMTCAYGSSLGYLPTATRTGYTFAGWYTAASGGTQVTSSTVVTGAVTYYAHWTANTYTVTFNANGGSVSPASKSYTYNTTLGTLPTATRIDYAFTGWYTAAEGGTKVTESTKVTGAKTYYAHYEYSPRRVWINEVNILDLNKTTWENYDLNCQFIEIAAPEDVDLTGWRIDLIEPLEWCGVIYTNNIATFGCDGLSGTKDVNVASNYVFHVVANPDRFYGDRSVLERPGALDGIWNFDMPTSLFTRDFAIDYCDSFAIRLIRPDGIIEHEIVTVGTNIYDEVSYNAQFLPTGVVAYLNREMKPAEFFYAGTDCVMGDYSVGVVNGHGEQFGGNSVSNWSNTMRRTPGMINANQQIVFESGRMAVVTFNANGGESARTTRTVVRGQPVGTLPTATRTGYTFDGWYTAASGGTQVTADTVVNADGTYYAQWTATMDMALSDMKLAFQSGGDASWTVVADASRDGAVAQSGKIGASQTSWIETSVKGPATLSFWWKVGSESNYDKLHWYIDGSEQKNISGTVGWTQVTAEIAPGSHTVRWSYTKDGGVNTQPDCGWVDDVVVETTGVQLWKNGPYWAECNIGATQPEESGYYFWLGDTVGYKRNAANDGWVSVKDGSSFEFRSKNCPTYNKSNSELQSAGYIDSTGNLVAAHDAAAAHWGGEWRMPTDAEFGALISNCTTTWTTRNGVYGRLVTGKGDYASKSIFLPAAGYGGVSYFFELGSVGYYWSSTPNSGSSDCAWLLYFASGYFSRGNFSDRYSGRSVRPVRYKNMVTFDANGGSVSPMFKSYEDNESLGTLPTATRTGYTFAGWFTAASGGTQVTSSTVVTGAVTYYAHWTVNTYTVTYNANGGTVSPTSKSYTYNATLGTLPTATRAGYTFAGWYTAASGGTQVTSSTVVTGAVTYYAHWTVNTYTVTYNANGGTVSPTSKSYTYNATLGTLPTATRAGYTFAGWFTAASGGTQVTSSTVVTGAVTYYAHWKDTGVQLWENGPYWAECNVGATQPEEAGYYFWWGDTVGYKRNAADDGWVSVKDGTSFSFSSSNCPTYGKDKSALQSAGYIDSTGNLVAAHDAAAVHWGEEWRMPTSAEIDALISNCTTTWTTRNGVYGRLVTGKGNYSSKSIFLPAVGRGHVSSLYGLGSYGDFWSSTPLDSFYSAWLLLLDFDSGYFARGSSNRFSGQSVRPVRGFAK